MSLAILFHFLCTQHVTDINITITRSLRLLCLITTLVVLQNNTTNMAIQKNIRKLLMMDILMSEKCWANKKWNKKASDIKLVFYSSTVTIKVSSYDVMKKMPLLPHASPEDLNVVFVKYVLDSAETM